MDFEKVEISRMKDKASPTNLNILDVFRRWLFSRKKNLTMGDGVTFKRGVSISICKSGELKIGNNSFLHSGVWLLLTMPRPRVDIGKWVMIGKDTIIASKNRVKIGDFTVFAPRCYVVDHEHGFDSSDVILNQRSVLKEVVIGRDCYFGTGVTILGGVTVGDGAIIGAGSVVTRDIPSYEMWAGIPAKFIKKR